MAQLLTVVLNMRKTLWLLIPALLLVGGYLYLRFTLQSSIRTEEKRTAQTPAPTDTLGGKNIPEADLRPLFIKRVQQVVKNSSNGLYDLAIADLKVDALASTLSLQGVRLTPDAAVADSLKRLRQLPADVFTITLDSLRIEGINLDDAVTSTTMDYRLIKLIKPAITIHHQKKNGAKAKPKTGGFSQRFLAQLKKLAVKNVVVEDGTVRLYNNTKKEPPTILKGVSVRLINVLLDSTTRNETDRFFFAKSGTVSFRDFSRRTPDGLYTLKIGTVTVTAPQDRVQLTKMSFASPLNRAQFTARQTSSKELYNLQLPSVSLTGVNWWAMLNDEAVAANELNVAGGRLSIFLDRSLPPRNRMGNFPNQLLMKLSVPLRIDHVKIQGLKLSYAEYNPLSQQTGTIYLDNVALRMAHLSNEPRTPPVSLAATALFMHTVPVQARFSFDRVQHKTGRFTASLNINGFDGTLLNSFIIPMALLNLERGTIHSAEASVQGNEKAASGTVTLRYNDLKLALLERDKGKDSLDKKSVTSLLANLVVLKKDNPKGDDPLRTETAEFTRIPTGGFFMLVWKTILTGTLKTVGAPTKMATKTAGNPKE